MREEIEAFFTASLQLTGKRTVFLGWASAEEAEILVAKAEAEVFARFKGLARGKTALLISHRFSTVRMADRIVVLEDGRVTEHGTHEELVLRGGTYAELFTLQAAGYR